MFIQSNYVRLFGGVAPPPPTWARQPGPLTLSGPSGALHTGAAWSLMCGSARRLVSGQDPSLRINVARNSPSSISNVELTSLELQRFEAFFKTDRVKLRATFVWLWLCRRPRASQISRVKPLSPLLARLCVGLKPPSPLLAQAEPQMKPPSPLRARNRRFGCVFRLQWCRRFQRLLFKGEQWCRRFHAGLHQWLQRCYWFQSWHVAVFCARKSSPCSARCGHEREKVRPAHEKWLKIGVLWRAGRVFSR